MSTRRLMGLSWNHVCCIYDDLNSANTFVLNGKVHSSKIRTPDAQKSFFGEYQGKNIKLASSEFKGDISDLNIWKSNLSTDDALNWTSCKTYLTGNFINWTRVELNNSGMAETDQEEIESCTAEVIGLMKMEFPLSYTEADLICRKLGGYVGFPSADAIQKSSSFEESDGMFWTGFTDLKEETSFEDHLGQCFNDSYWLAGEPNGERIENCAAVYRPNMVTMDVECGLFLNFYCWSDKVYELRLRGIPDRYNIDDTYYFDFKTETFKGAHKSEIKMFAKNRHVITSSNKAVLSISDQSIPLGKLNWIDPATNQSVLLSMDICNSTQYNCDNGICIDIENRCDHVLDCPDGSDENYCYTVIFPPYYKHSEIPVTKTDEDEEPLILDIIYFSLRLVDIKETESKMFIQFGLFTRWRDNRLQYHNLELNANNTVTVSEMEMMWLPEYTVFMLTEDGLIEDKGSRNLVLIPEKIGTPTETENVNKSLVFDGKDVDILIRHWFSATIVCDLEDLANYPFDTNECQFKLALFGTPSAWDYSMKKVALKKSFKLKYAPKQFGAYHVNSVKTELTSSCRMKVTIRLKRRFFSVFIKDSLPSILLSIIVYLSNIYYIRLFDTAMAVNVTCLLAISGFFIAVFASIPETSNVKTMDLLQIKSIIIVTLIILMQTFFVCKDRNCAMKKGKIQKMVDWMLPAIGLGIDAVYVAYGILNDLNLK